MQLVRAMHEKFELANTTGPIPLSEEEKRFRIAALREEITEYEDTPAHDLVGQFDALLDLLVFGVGTLERHGFPLQSGFEAVMRANMTKSVGQNGSKRGGFQRDLVKPVDFIGPEQELGMILRDQRRWFEDAALEADVSGSVELLTGVPGKQLDWVGRADPTNTTMKFDDGKLPLDLVPVESIRKVAEVFAFGAKKYARENWRAGNPPQWSRIYASIQRHLTAFWAREDIDPESGLSHLAHAATQVLMLLYYVQFHADRDDRFKRGA